MKPAEADRLTIDEIAHHLRVTRWSVSRAIAAGDIEAIRVPGKGRDGAKRIPLASYLAYLGRSVVARQAEDQPMTDIQPAELPALHDFRDVARRYNISLRGLRLAAREKRFEHMHIGTQRYFTDEQLTAYLASRVVKAEKADDGLGEARAKRARRDATGSRRSTRRVAA